MSSPWSRHSACVVCEIACGEPEDCEQVADGERDHHRRGDAAPPAPAGVAEADLGGARQEADAPQQRVARVLAADRRARRLEGLA